MSKLKKRLTNLSANLKGWENEGAIMNLPVDKDKTEQIEREKKGGGSMDAKINHLEEKVTELEGLLLRFSEGTAKALEKLNSQSLGLPTARAIIWFEAWKTVAGASNCTNKTSPADWADACLTKFDAKFGGDK